MLALGVFQCASVPRYMAVVPCRAQVDSSALSVPKEVSKTKASDAKGLHKEHSMKEAVQGH